MFLTVNGSAADAHNHAALLETLPDDGVFDTMRIYSGQPFKLESHTARLNASAAQMNIEIPGDLTAVLAREIQRARDAGLVDAILRITLARRAGTGEFTTITMIDDLPPLNPEWYSRGIRLERAPDRRDEFSAGVSIKTVASLKRILAFRQVRREGFDDLLFLDTKGHVSEATASNVFLYNDGKLSTPPTACGALPGITRATVKEIASAGGITVTDERPVNPAELHEASEIFLTSSVREILPVASVDGRTIGEGRPGEVTRQIMNAYSRMTQSGI